MKWEYMSISFFGKTIEFELKFTVEVHESSKCYELEVEVDWDKRMQLLNDFGAKGWECYAVESSGGNYYYHLKRKIS